MISLRRLDEPSVLKENKAKWLARYLEDRAKSPGKRPSSSQYAHAEVVQTLEAMSFHKCFYCEQSTKAGNEVDHYIEVAEDPGQAFEWTNLYLTCGGGRHGCNNKIANASLPVANCLDPCNPADRPEDHLTFDDELIRARDSSARGLQTIQKYRLDRPGLDYKRIVQIKQLLKAKDQIQARMIAEGRKTMTDEERDLLRAFAQPNRPFSLMFAVLLRGLGL